MMRYIAAVLIALVAGCSSGDNTVAPPTQPVQPPSVTLQPGLGKAIDADTIGVLMQNAATPITYTVTVDSVVVMSGSSQNTTFNIVVPSSTLASGVHAVVVKATDKSGISASATTSVTIVHPVVSAPTFVSGSNGHPFATGFGIGCGSRNWFMNANHWATVGLTNDPADFVNNIQTCEPHDSYGFVGLYFSAPFSEMGMTEASTVYVQVQVGSMGPGWDTTVNTARLILQRVDLQSAGQSTTTVSQSLVVDWPAAVKGVTVPAAVHLGDAPTGYGYYITPVIVVGCKSFLGNSPSTIQLSITEKLTGATSSQTFSPPLVPITTTCQSP